MPLPVSRHHDLDVGVHALQPDLHAPAPRRELHRVGQQVPDDLLQAVGVAGHGAGARIEHRLQRGSPLASAAGRTRVERRLDDATPASTGLHVEAQLAGDDAGDVEQVLDELELGVGVALDDVERARLAVGRVERCRRAACAPSRARRSAACAARARAWPGTRPSRGWPPRPRPAPPAAARTAARCRWRSRPAGASPGHDRLLALREDADVGVAEEEPAEHLAASGRRRRRRGSSHRQVAGRHPVVRRVLAVARILRDVVDAHHALAPEGRPEEIGVARHREAGERLARHAGDRVERVGLAAARRRRCRRTRRTRPGTAACRRRSRPARAAPALSSPASSWPVLVDDRQRLALVPPPAARPRSWRCRRSLTSVIVLAAGCGTVPRPMSWAATDSAVIGPAMRRAKKIATATPRASTRMPEPAMRHSERPSGASISAAGTPSATVRPVRGDRLKAEYVARALLGEAAVPALARPRARRQQAARTRAGRRTAPRPACAR